MTGTTQLTTPLQLQVNQTGAWRGALDFDVPVEEPVPVSVLVTAVELVEVTKSPGVRLRIVRRQAGWNGRAVASNTVLMHWSEKTGWANVAPVI